MCIIGSKSIKSESESEEEVVKEKGSERVSERER